MKVQTKHYTFKEAVDRYHMFCKRNDTEEKHITKVDVKDNLIRLFNGEILVHAFMPEILQTNYKLKVGNIA